MAARLAVQRYFGYASFMLHVTRLAFSLSQEVRVLTADLEYFRRMAAGLSLLRTPQSQNVISDQVCNLSPSEQS